MSEAPVWDVAPPYDLIRKGLLAPGMTYLPGYLDPSAYIDNLSMSCHPLRPVLHIDANALELSAFERYSDSPNGDSHCRQLSYIYSFRQGASGLGESSPTTPFFDFPDANIWDASSSAYVQSPPTSASYTGSCIVSPRANPKSSLSSTSSFSQSPEVRLLDVMTLQSPVADCSSPEEYRQVPTIVDRFGALSPSSQRLFRTCGSDPFIQAAVLDILESPELQAKVAITSAMTDPLLEKVRYAKPAHGKGKRGAPQFYKCLWGSCGDKMSRKLHALEHIMAHADNRSHICNRCGKGFVRKNELKKHSPCKSLKRKLKCIDREFVPFPSEPPSSSSVAHVRCQDLSTIQPSYSMSAVSASCYSEQQTHPRAPILSAPLAQLASFNTESSAVNAWGMQADSGEAGYSPYSQPVRVTKVSCLYGFLAM